MLELATTQIVVRLNLHHHPYHVLMFLTLQQLLSSENQWFMKTVPNGYIPSQAPACTSLTKVSFGDISQGQKLVQKRHQKGKQIWGMSFIITNITRMSHNIYNTF